MTKYVDAEKLKAHIQHLIKKDNYELFDVPELLSFIDSLQQEQPDVDLEKEIEEYFEGWSDDSEYGQAIMRNCACAGVDECKDIARYFYNLGLNTRK
jgi:hypothetical protein